MEQDHTHRGPVAFRFDKVSFSYGSVKVLEDVSFHIHQGDFAALVGANGSGKTTILKLLLGLEKPQAGTITLFDETASRQNNYIGYVPQNAGFDPAFPISVHEVVRMGRLSATSRKFTALDETAVQEALERTEILDLASRPYSALSGGQRRRVLVARALASKPGLLILDEPTANMDSESEARLFRTLGELKGSTTVLIVTHDSGFVSELTNVVLCVGERNDEGCSRSVVRHRTGETKDAPHELYGGHAVKVRHDIVLPDADCHGEENAK